MSNGSTILIIGAPGMGKSPFTQRFINGRACLIFDVNNEYGTKTKYPGQTPIGLSSDTREPRSRYIGGDVDAFISLCGTKKNTVCVFEEATAFFSGKTDKHMRRLLINRYHTGNVYLLLFHSIAMVPPVISDLTSKIVIFRTNDEPARVKAKMSRLLPYYEDLKTKPNGTKYIINAI